MTTNTGKFGSISRGALAGVLATGAMTGLMLLLKKAGAMGKLPPTKITERAMSVIGVHPSEAETGVATMLAHFGFGATMGGLYGLIPRRSDDGLHPSLSLARGAAYGLAIWAVAYMEVVPKLGIMSFPRNDRPGRPTSMVLSHLVYGVALAALSDKLRGEQRPKHNSEDFHKPGANPGEIYSASEDGDDSDSRITLTEPVDESVPTTEPNPERVHANHG